jgi:general secretion pathway protein K
MSRRAFAPPSERGAALLAVLILVAITGALAAAALEKLRLSTATARNVVALDLARGFAVGIESLVLLTIDDGIAQSPDRTTLAGGWNGATRQVPMPGGGGTAFATVRDGGNCFNINSVAQGEGAARLAARPAGIDQLTGLLMVLQVPETQARTIAQSAADWVDADSERLPSGAEDAEYVAGERPFRTGNTLFADPSELRAVRGMLPEVYDRLRPWICALPATDLSPININTLLPTQAPLLAMLAPGQLGLEEARRIIEARPTTGWASQIDFWRIEALSELNVPLDVQMQPQLRTRWFALDIRIESEGAEFAQSVLIDANRPPARIVARRWGSEG